ncbi:MAG: hypothetical protein B7Z35_03225 [Hydrogenophilales bacterium 12-61-10]|nr:MAG: hypothetical protein B7Z35_03225 [Hydrogenophilales bacterium 12-61-10]
MMCKSALLAVLLLGLSACSVLPPSERLAPRPSPVAPAMPALLSDLARVATLSPEQRRRELATLDSSRRLDDAKRFQLAALLEREDSAEAYERGLKALAAMEETDSRTQALADLLKRTLKARLELKQQTVRADELHDKLDQIKALEKSLQQRSSPAKVP